VKNAAERKAGQPAPAFPVRIIVALLALASAVLSAGGAGAASSPAPAAAEPEYRIGPDDVLSVVVWRNETFSRVVRVRPDGKITLPLLNDIQAAGLSSAKLGGQIADRLAEFLDSPRVTVIVQEINSAKVTVMGEVKKPGVYPMRGEMTVLDAIALAEGLGEFASPNQMVILRKFGANRVRIKVRYRDILVGGSDAREYALFPGDTIVVP
jgi:polysaccharide export outer membrane protein